MPQLRVLPPSSEPQVDPAATLAAALSAHFKTGSTKSRTWRLSQLDALEHFLVEREQDILDALHADLRKPAMEAFASEIAVPLSELRLARKKLATWMKPERVRKVPKMVSSKVRIASTMFQILSIWRRSWTITEWM